MAELMDTGFRWSLFLIVATTCVVMIYLILMLTKWMGKARGTIRIIRKVKVKELPKKGVAMWKERMAKQEPTAEEVLEMEPVIANKRKFSFHKWFWIGVGISYLLSIFLIFWYFVALMLGMALIGKFMAKRV